MCVIMKESLTLKSGWRRSSLSGVLTAKGTRMREQGNLKEDGTQRRNLCVDTQIVPNPYAAAKSVRRYPNCPKSGHVDRNIP